MTLGGWNIAKIEVKGQRSSKIWQPLKKDIKSHSFVTVCRQKLIFGRMREVHRGIIAFLWKMTLVKVKVTIEGHKGQILGQNSDLTYFQHMALWEIMVNDIESDCTS